MGDAIRRAKIVCTLGPASLQADTIAAMLRAGMDVARLNTSHGTLDDHLAALKLVRSVAEAEAKPVAVLLDLSGPKLRTGSLQGHTPVMLEPGAALTLTPDEREGDNACVSVAYERLADDVRAGDHVLLDDGRLELEVVRVAPPALECRVLVGGLLGEHKGVSFPNTVLTMPALTVRDQECLRAGVAAGADYLALSFVRDASDIVRARELVRAQGADTPIIAKIERRQAIANLDAILAEADGVMVARGDLGVELPPEEVPVQQRAIIAAAARNLIPVIIATQMLESMVEAPRPTRAESSDVAHAAWELSDALMLSEETAIGQYVVESVAMMDRIIRRAEQSPLPDIEVLPTDDDHSYVIALAARRIVESDPNVNAIACFTRSGRTAILLSKVHPNATIYAITPDAAVARRLSLARSVVPVLGPAVTSSEELLRFVDDALTAPGRLAQGEEVVVVASLPVRVVRGATNFLKLHRLGESGSY